MQSIPRQSVIFTESFDKPLTAVFDARATSSDGGAILPAAVDRGIGLSARLAGCLHDWRDPARIEHELIEMMRQRIFGIALGYEDCNDAGRIGADPVMKLCCGRAPVKGADLASQPTLSRFENAPTGRELALMSRVLEDTALERLKKEVRRPKRVTLDLDPAVDPTHGQQAFSFFHGKYGTWCYLPMFGFVSAEGTDQHLFCARLRPGTSRESRATAPMLRRMVAKVRACFPGARVLVRLDAGFARPMILDLLDELGVDYVVSIPGNRRLDGEFADLVSDAMIEAKGTGESAKLFGECRYAAKTWPRERRVICKAEVVMHPGREPKKNPRYVVTNLRNVPERVYGIYCGRGDAENRIKELKVDLSIDRTSCSAFLANQMRVLMTAAAYGLYQELRLRLRRTEGAKLQVGTLRLQLMKIAARFDESVRRVVMHLAEAHPWMGLWLKAAKAVGATPT